MGREAKRKLSKEELKEENKKLRKQIAAGTYTSEDSERIVKNLSTKNLMAYALAVLLPPVGVWYIWKHKEELYMRESTLWLWTFVAGVIFVQHIIYIYQHFIAG
ncbi:MAG: hypothetical protein IKS37_12905 [Solobacterium sp.]|nr:hypothetical protein [Solobacterium sp.]